MESGTSCMYSIGLGVPRQYSVIPPLELTRQGDTYRGEVAIDRYVPGRCGWGFAGMWYFVPSTNTELQRELFFYDGDVNKPAESRMDIWCHKWADLDPKQPPDCSSIDAFKAATSNSNSEAVKVLPMSLYDDIVARGGRNGPPIRVGTESRSIVIQFHDMDAADGGRSIRTE